LRALLNEAGFVGVIIDVTPNLDSERGLEIKKWIQTSKFEILSFVILDDDSDFNDIGFDRLVRTDPFQGLTSFNVEEAKKILGLEFK
jgi:hypothetical protein